MRWAHVERRARRGAVTVAAVALLAAAGGGAAATDGCGAAGGLAAVTVPVSGGAGGAAAAEAALPPAGPRPLALPWPSGGPASRPAAALGEPSDPAPRPAPRAYRSRRFVAGVGLAAAGAAVAWWSEGRADRAYRRYLHAAAWRRQERALDDAERYDRVTGGAYLAMHTGMVVCACVLVF